ncbi:hypothetical protein ACHAXA_009615 [Cyclostephanos tholiformis]|uniref:Uncharacterized protein n=1 Tax=Cyclostephanos tholiformis TaxID=382380 RepID=A0ABD3RG05_9STRA
MVLNNREPYDTDSSDDTEISWEMIVDGDEGGTAPFPHRGVPNFEFQRPSSANNDAEPPLPHDYDASVGATISGTPPAAAAAAAAADNDASVGVTISRTPTTTTTPDAAAADESPLDNDVSIGVTISDGDTFFSGVSSITGEHHTVSDIEDGEEDDDDDDGGDGEDGGGEATMNERKSFPGASPSESTGDGGGGEDRAADVVDVPSSTDVVSSLVGWLSEMGFEHDRIARAVSDLRSMMGATEIDADVVIGIMMDEAVAFEVADADNMRRPSSCGAKKGDHPLEPLLDVWEYVGSTISRGWDERGGIPARRLVEERVRAIGRTARGALSSVADESHRLVRRLVSQDREGEDYHDDDDDDDDYDDYNVDARSADRYSTATAQMSPTKHPFRRAIEEHRILEKVVAVAVVGSAALLALGNPRASLGAMAVAGAGLAAGEAIRCSSEQSCGGKSRGHGLHLD